MEADGLDGPTADDAQLELAGERYPPYVITDADRERWDLSENIAREWWRLYEDGPVNPEYLWLTTRQIYHSDVDTGAPDAPSANEVAEAVAIDDEPAGPDDDTVRALFDELDAARPSKDESDVEAHWAHVGRVADFFDALFGNPDDYPLLEAVSVPYSSAMHPRDRMGEWSAKLGGVHRAGGDRLRQELALRLAARHLKQRVASANRPGGALHAPVTFERGAGTLAHNAAEERFRQSKVRKARHATFHAKAHALTALATVYSEEGERKLGPLAHGARDATASLDELEHARSVGELSHEAARFVAEHHNALRTALHAAAHLGRAIAHAHGLAASADDEREADEVLALVE